MSKSPESLTIWLSVMHDTSNAKSLTNLGGTRVFQFRNSRDRPRDLAQLPPETAERHHLAMAFIRNPTARYLRQRSHLLCMANSTTASQPSFTTVRSVKGE
jgi:hypothetical protein